MRGVKGTQCEHGDADRYAGGGCRICARAYQLSPEQRAAKSVYGKTPERKAVAAVQRAVPEHRKAAIVRTARWTAANPDRARALKHDHAFGKGAGAWYAVRLIAAGYRCENPACRKTVAENGRALSLDHDHGCHYCGGTGCSECWRSILCDACNKDAHRMLNIDRVAGLLTIMEAHRATVEVRAA